MNKNHANTFLRALVVSAALALAVAACGTDGASDETAGDASSPGIETSTTVVVSDGEQDQTDASQEVDGEGGSTDDANGSSTVGPNVELFFEGALAEDVTTEDCTLSGGTVATCYRITVTGYPADHEVGPFCPETIEATADEVGIWFDGVGIYDLDGAFILGLADLYDDANWMLYDEDGNVNVTDTAEAFDAAARPDVDPEYQNHCVEGRIEWLDNGEPISTTVLIPTVPVPAASPAQSRDGLGVTLNGVTIAVAAPVDAILGAYTIAAFDDCGGHINPFDGYHLHGAVGCGEVEIDGHASMFGFALDGYAIHSPYDEKGEVYGDLDTCGGHTTIDLGYHYHASPPAENSVIGCLSGETAG